MIQLSRAKVNKRIPKNRFGGDLGCIDTIVWAYKISPDTTDLHAGNTVEEFQIFEITPKAAGVKPQALKAIQKEIPYPILFITSTLNYFAIEGEIMESGKKFLENDTLLLDVKSTKLTDLYEAIAEAFITTARRSGETIPQLIARKNAITKLDKDIANLQRKTDSEKQPNKRIELNNELKKLKVTKEDFQL